MHTARSTGMERLAALVVDDSDVMRSILRAILRGLGVGAIQEAADVPTGLRLLRAGEIDLVIVDWMMGPPDGLDFVREVRTGADIPAPQVPILMVTGHCEAWRVQAARDAGVTEFLAKPVSARSVAERIDAMLNRPRPFIREPHFTGPDRRRHQPGAPGKAERRRRPPRLLTEEEASGLFREPVE
jgi:two-component system chemotaxis response regulator CheY